MIGKKGKDLVTIPLPPIDIPHFQYGHKEQGGVGQGDGEVGDALGQGDGRTGRRPGRRAARASTCSRSTSRWTSWPQILGEELQLPRIEPKGTKRIVAQKDTYTGIRTTGPESLRHFKRTYKQALRRQIAMRHLQPRATRHRPDPRGPALPHLEAASRCPQNNAVIIYMMDVSGSMGDEQKEIVRIESFWIDTWLRSQYKGLETPLHHPRRGGAGGRPRHLLPHPRVAAAR